MGKSKKNIEKDLALPLLANELVNRDFMGYGDSTSSEFDSLSARVSALEADTLKKMQKVPFITNEIAGKDTVTTMKDGDSK